MTTIADGGPRAGADSVDAKARDELPREVLDFLVDLSLALHRYALYPSDHPMIQPAVEKVMAHAGKLFQGRGELQVIVARRQLAVDRVATDPGHAVLSDLARKLHEQQVGAVTFLPGFQASEVDQLLDLLARVEDPSTAPLGLRPPAELPAWPHLKLHPFDLGGLTRTEGSSQRVEGRAGDLWLGLSRAALSVTHAMRPDEAPTGSLLADRIRVQRRTSDEDRVLGGYMQELAGELKWARGREAEEVRSRLSTLLRELDRGTLRRIVQMGGGDPAARRRLLQDANETLPVDVVVKLLSSAADATDQGISGSLTRLLAKLASHAGQGSERFRAQADTALRDNVEELMASWELQDPNPERYTLVLDAMSRATPVLRHDEDPDPLEGAHRLLQISVEVDAYGPTVKHALSRLLDEGRLAEVLGLIADAPEGSAAARELRRELSTPPQLRRILAGEDVDEDDLWPIVEAMGSAAVEPLMDALVDSDSRSVRRKAFDCLVRLGDGLGEEVARRLADSRWFVQRNMLALLQRVGSLPTDFSLRPFLRHADFRVRREALLVALRHSDLRETGLAAALADADERLVRMALHEIQEEIPEALVPILVSRVVVADRDPELTVLATRALGSSRSPLALDTLIALVSPGPNFLGRCRLWQTTPELLAAVRVLARAWSEDTRVQKILRAAARSRDPEVRAALPATEDA